MGQTWETACLGVTIRSAGRTVGRSWNTRRRDDADVDRRALTLPGTARGTRPRARRVPMSELRAAWWTARRRRAPRPSHRSEVAGRGSPPEESPDALSSVPHPDPRPPDTGVGGSDQAAHHPGIDGDVVRGARRRPSDRPRRGSPVGTPDTAPRHGPVDGHRRRRPRPPISSGSATDRRLDSYVG